MNLPDIHTQKLLDCLTHSRLGFALYRLPWTDECYLVLQTSGDVEQLADIQELNGKKGFVMAPFQDIGGTSLGTYPSGCHRIRLERNQRSTVFTGMCGCPAHLQKPAE